MFSKKSLSLTKEKSFGWKEEGKASRATSPLFEKAKSLVPLDERAEAATESAWETYMTNRVAAEKIFPGPKEKRSKSAMDDEEGDEDDHDEEDENEYGDFGETNALNLIRYNMGHLEEAMELDEGVLTKSFRVLSCDALFEEDEPRTMTTLTRIYSPTRPVYIDVHFQYHCRSRCYPIEWYYTLGFKIYNRPGTNDYHPSEIRKFENGCFDHSYSGNGWRSVAYGFFDDCGDHDEKWVRVENAKFILGEEDVKDVYEALWGPLDDNQGDEDDDDDDDDEELNDRSKMVNTVRVLMAAAGIGYNIAIDDDERDDSSGVFMLEGLSDRWFARGVRKACGFQLTKDPENEKKGPAEREEEMNRDDDDSDQELDDDDDDDF